LESAESVITGARVCRFFFRPPPGVSFVFEVTSCFFQFVLGLPPCLFVKSHVLAPCLIPPLAIIYFCVSISGFCSVLEVCSEFWVTSFFPPGGRPDPVSFSFRFAVVTLGPSYCSPLFFLGERCPAVRAGTPLFPFSPRAVAFTPLPSSRGPCPISERPHVTPG